MKEKSEKKDVIFHKYPLVEFNRIRSYIQKLLCKKNTLKVEHHIKKI